jgi:hypothetical protein
MTNGGFVQKLTAAMALAALALAGPAHADSADDAYLAAVRALGLPTVNAPALIAGGHATCDQQGNPFGLLGAQGQLVSAGVPYGLMPQVTIAAGRVYCPDRLHAVGLN